MPSSETLEHDSSPPRDSQQPHLTEKELSELVSDAEEIIDFKVGQLKEDSDEILKEVDKHYNVQKENIQARASFLSSVLENIKLEFENECQRHRKLHSTSVRMFIDKIENLKCEIVDTVVLSKRAIKDADQECKVSLKEKLIKLIVEFDTTSISGAQPFWSFENSENIDRNRMEVVFSTSSTPLPNTPSEPVSGNSNDSSTPMPNIPSEPVSGNSNDSSTPLPNIPSGPVSGNSTVSSTPLPNIPSEPVSVNSTVSSTPLQDSSDDPVSGNNVVQDTSTNLVSGTSVIVDDDDEETSAFLSFLKENNEECGAIEVTWAKDVETIIFGSGRAIQGILPVKNGELWVLFRGTNALLRLTQNGKILQKVEVGKPYSYINDIFCSTDFSTLYMCSGEEDSIFQLQADGNLKFLFKTDGEPITLALTKGNDLIISLADGGVYEGFFREVVLFSISGHSMNTFGKKRNRRELFGYPSKIKVNRINGDIAIVNQRSVTVLSRTFIVKYKYKEEILDSDDDLVNVLEPRDACFDARNNLLICNSADNSIRVLDSMGQLKHVLKLLYKPKVVAIGPDGKLWVGFDCGKIQHIQYDW